MIDVDVKKSPGWWMQRLSKKLVDKRKRYDELDSFLRGEPPMDIPVDPANRKAYEAFWKKANTNLAELVVEACRYRMDITGFRTAAGGDENGDEKARAIWDANGLVVESADVHQTMLALSDAYVIVGQPDEETGIPAITSEDPREVVTEHDPVQQRKIRAALKIFHDDIDDRDYAYLYLPGRVYVAYRETTATVAPRFSAKSFVWDDERGGEDGQVLPVETMMPVVRFRNRKGWGEYEHHIGLLQRIHQTILQRMQITALQAFKQRAVKGDLPKTYPANHPKAGQEIDYDELFKADPGALWLIPGTAEIWESQQVDLSGILNSVKDDILHFAAVTQTPLHMFNPDAASGSAEGASLQREGIVFKAKDRIARASDAWSQVMGIAFLWMGDEERADWTKIEPIWAAPEMYSLTERFSAAVQAKGAGVPWRTRLMDIAGFTPDQVKRMETERSEDDLLMGAADGGAAA